MAIRVEDRVVDPVRVAVFGVDDERPRLLVPIRLRWEGRIRPPATVGHGKRLQRVAEVIYFQGQRMADARICWIALVVIGQALDRMAEVYTVVVAVLWLQLGCPMASLSDQVGVPGL